MTAMTAATLDQLSDGRDDPRHRLLGPAGGRGLARPARSRKQLLRTREYVAILRKALARERLEFDGDYYELPLPDGPGKALKLMIAPGAGADPDLHRGDRAEEHAAHAARSPTAGCRRSSPPSTSASRRKLLEEGAAQRGERQGDRRLVRHRAERERSASRTTSTGRATRCGRSSRCTSAAWARATRTSTTSSCSATASRRTPRRCRTSTSTARRTRPPRRCSTELIDTVALVGPKDRVARPAAGLPRRGRRDARVDADRVHG